MKRKCEKCDKWFKVKPNKKFLDIGVSLSLETLCPKCRIKGGTK